MDKKIKLCQDLRASICTTTASSQEIRELIDEIIATAKPRRNAPNVLLSSALKVVISSLLSLCDNLYLNKIKIYNHKINNFRWYKVHTSKIEPIDENFLIIRSFLTNLYYKTNGEAMMHSNQTENAILQFRYISKRKALYGIYVHMPNPITQEHIVSMINGLCYAFDSIIDRDDILTKIATYKILYKNLIEQLNFA